MISVCIATYNGSAYIKEQLVSILDQISNNDEIIISDDGSTDNTLDIVNELNDSRIKLIDGERHLGIIKNFERALYAAKGEYIFLCDQDDIWLPGKVKQFLSVLTDNILAVSDCIIVDGNLHEVYPSFFQIRGSQSGLFHNILRNSYLGCCMAFRKELLKYALPIPKYSPMHDMWIGLVAETRGKVTFIEKPLTLYRRHNNNASPTSGKSKFNFFKKIKLRVLLSYFLLIRTLRNLFVI
jgi:glycosyltransferase involved in cell wall biosynthesis